MASTANWQPRRPISRLLTDLAAGRPFMVPESFGSDHVALAARHGLLGIMAHSGDLRLEDAARLHYTRLIARQRVMMNHLPRLLAALDAASIPATVLKGPVLAAKYRVPAHRTFTDIDLVVPPVNLDECIELLQKDPVVRAVPPQRPKADKRDILLVDPDTDLRFSIDLHWDTFSYHQMRGRTRGAMAASWSGANRIDDQVGPRWELPQESEIAFLCAHAIFDHRFRLILFRDLVEVARGPVGWESVVEFATRYGLRSTTYLALLIASRALDAEVPEDVLANLRPRGTAMRGAEVLLPRTDLVTFDGHRPHPLNLSVVLAHDEFLDRAGLVLRAPLAILPWSRRVMAAEGIQAASMDTPTLTVLVASTQRRGAEVFGERLTAGLADLGWSSELVALAANRTEASSVEAHVLSSKRSAELGRLDWGTVLSLRKHLRESESDVLLAYGSSTLKYGVAATRLMWHRPRLAYASIGEPLFWARKLHQRLSYRSLLKLVDLVLSVSAKTGAQLSTRLGVPGDKVRIVHTGVPRELLDLKRAKPSDELRIVFVGSLSDEKNPLLAVEVFKLVANSVPARLRIIGSGPLEGRVRGRVDELGIGDRVEITGSVGDVTPHLSWAHVLIMTSRTEGLPAAALEAAAASVAVVAFDVGGVADAVVDGGNGRLIGPGDVEGMVAALIFYATNPEERREAGRAGRKLVAEAFTIQLSVRHHDLVLRELLD